MPYAVWLLSRRRYAVNELKKKLIKKFGSDEPAPETGSAIEKIIARLVELKYLNDDEYADIFIRDQFLRKAQGFRMIEMKLKKKGIDETTISSAFAKQTINEDELIARAIAKKINTIKKTTQIQLKQKLFCFLVSRGFNTNAIVRNLKNVDTSLYKTASKG